MTINKLQSIYVNRASIKTKRKDTSNMAEFNNIEYNSCEAGESEKFWRISMFQYWIGGKDAEAEAEEKDAGNEAMGDVESFWVPHAMEDDDMMHDYTTVLEEIWLNNENEYVKVLEIMEKTKMPTNIPSPHELFSMMDPVCDM